MLKLVSIIRRRWSWNGVVFSHSSGNTHKLLPLVEIKLEDLVAAALARGKNLQVFTIIIMTWHGLAMYNDFYLLIVSAQTTAHMWGHYLQCTHTLN